MDLKLLSDKTQNESSSTFVDDSSGNGIRNNIKNMSDTSLDTYEIDSSASNVIRGDQNDTYRKIRRKIRTDSAYIKNKRISRYKMAMYSSLPFRSTSTNTDELPIDSVGFLSNSIFWWVRQYHVSRSVNNRKRNTPTITHNLNTVDEIEKIPQTTKTDCCRTNAKRLLGIYKYEEQTRGQKNASMFRVAWEFCRTRIIFATFIRILSILCGIIAISIFFKLLLDSVEKSSNLIIQRNELLKRNTVKNSTNSVDKFNEIENNISIESHHQIGYIFSFVGCIFGMIYLKSISNWHDLRTSIRLRSACIGATFTKSLESSVISKIAPHQIVSLCSDESEMICNLVQKGSLLISHTIGIILCLVTGVVLLGAPGMWPLLGIFGFILVSLIMAKISGYYYRRSVCYMSEKLSIIEDFYNSFTNIVYLHYGKTFQSKFSQAVSQQYLALFRAEMFQTVFTDCIMAATLLGGLYLIWCDVDIKTDQTEVLTLIVLYAYFVQTLTTECSASFIAIFQGKAVLEKVKNSIIMLPPDQARSRPDKFVTISLTQATFQWNAPASIISTVLPILEIDNEMSNIRPKSIFNLNIDNFQILKNHVTAVTGDTGSGKSSLIYALLGHMQHTNGIFRHTGKTGYFPEIPYMRLGSVRENITFFEQPDSIKYYNAISMAKLNEDIFASHPDCDDLSIDSLSWTAEQLQKITMARSIFCDLDTIIFDEPLSAIENDLNALDIFVSVTKKLIDLGRTVVVFSKNNVILSQCHRVYLLTDGEISRVMDYESVQRLPAYRKIVQTYEGEKSLTNKFGENYNICIESNENLPKTILMKNQMNFSCFSLFYLIILHLFNSFIYIGIPFTFIIVIMEDKIYQPWPWPSPIIFAFILTLLFTNFLVKQLLFTVGRRLVKKLHRQIFDNLLNSSLLIIKQTRLSDLLSVLLENNLMVFHIRSIVIYNWMIIILCNIAIGLSNWIVVIVVAISFTLYYILSYFRYRKTISYYADLGYKTKTKLLENITNQLKGRAVIQSFGQIEKAEEIIYELIEKNSTIVFLKKAIIFYRQFTLELLQIITIIAVLLIYKSDYNSNVYQYAVSVFCIFIIKHCLAQLLDVQFEKIVIDKPVVNANKILKKLSSKNEITYKVSETKRNSVFYNKEQTTGLSIEFKKVLIKINQTSSLRIHGLNIENGEKVGIYGMGAHLIPHLLIRNVDETIIYLDQKPLSSYSNMFLEENIGIVPANPCLFGVSIRSVLNAENDSSISSALNRFDLWLTVQSLPKELDEPMSSLNQEQRQLLSLARCWLAMPSILIIEDPLPNIQGIVDSSISGFFNQCTVIIIGTAEKQFYGCDRVINLNDCI